MELTMTKPAMLFEKLRDDIIKGELPAGTRLPQQQIADKYGVSKVLTVAAFSRLEATGLVESAIGDGVRVRTIDREMLEENYTFREAIETQTIREACLHASDREIAELKEMAKQLQADEGVESVRLDQEFHLKIAKMSRCRRLVQELTDLQLLQMFVSQVTVYSRVGDLSCTHMKLVEPIERRDPVEADQQMRLHLRSARRCGIQAFLESRSA